MTTILDESKALLQRIVLIACGSFSPPTPMHLRMFEIARDHYEEEGGHKVIGGIVSPTHDAYGKKGLVAATHRIAMLKLALQSSDWIRVSRWETEQDKWTRTREVLAFHQNYMNNYMNSPNDSKSFFNNWLPNGLHDSTSPIQLKLLCGADLLESFATPNLWADEDIEDIVANHGLVVISRSGSNPEKFIFDSDILTKYKRNITLITNWVPNEVSSTMIRRLVSRGQSVKYLIDDAIINYIKCWELYNCHPKYMMRNTDDNNLHHSDSNKTNNNNIIIEDDQYISLRVITPSPQPKPMVFCCSDSNNKAQKEEDNSMKSLVARRQHHVGMPGQAVQVITSNNETPDIKNQMNAKKMRISGGERV